MPAQRFSAGRRDERVRFEREVETQNEYGTLQRSTEEIATVWASVVPMSGSERERAQQTEGRAMYTITIPYRSDLTEKDYAVWRGKRLNLRFMKDAGPRRLLLDIEAELNAP